MLINKEKKQLFFREDKDDLVATFSRDALLKNFALGHSWISREYRRVDMGGVIRWIAYIAYLSRHEQTGHVQAFLFLQDVQLRHTRENSLDGNIHCSPVAGLYSRKTARMLAESVMHEDTARCLSTLTLVHIAGLSELEKDAQTVSYRRSFVHMAFSLLLGPECIIGEYGKDSFTVFRTGKVRRGDLRKGINDVLAFVRQTVLNSGRSFPLHFTVVMNCAVSANDDYEALLRSAERICAVHQYEPQDTVVFVPAGRKNVPPRFRGSAPAFRYRNILPPPGRSPPGGRGTFSLPERHMHRLPSCAPLQDPQRASLCSRPGPYRQPYQADRVYTLALIEDRRAVRVLQEWAVTNAHSHSKYITDMPVERLPLFKLCLNTKKPLFLNRNIKNPLGEDQRLWSYVVFPLMLPDSRTEGLLCMENPRAYRKNDALLPLLLPYIANACHFGQASKNGIVLEDSFTGLLNLNAYMDKIYLLTSDNYSSMGVLTISIANIAASSEHRDARQRAQMLLQLTEVLKALFGRALLFRTATTKS